MDEKILIPIGICVVMPVMIVWLITRMYSNKENRKADIIREAIKNNATVDTDRLIDAMSRRNAGTARELLNLRLLRGCIFTFLAVALGVCSGVVAHSKPDSDMQISLLILSTVSIAVGVSYLIVYFVSKKTIDTDRDSRGE